MQLYRAVSQAEMSDILSSGQFHSDPDGFTFGKWFALQPEDAAAWGNWFTNADGGKYSVVAAVLADEFASSLYQIPNLDNIGPAVFVEANQLVHVNFVQPLNIKILKTVVRFQSQNLEE